MPENYEESSWVSLTCSGSGHTELDLWSWKAPPPDGAAALATPAISYRNAGSDLFVRWPAGDRFELSLKIQTRSSNRARPN